MRWLRKFRFRIGDNWVKWITPLFAIWISDGGYDFLTDSYFWGMSICWGPCDSVDGMPFLRHEKVWTMRKIPLELFHLGKGLHYELEL